MARCYDAQRRGQPARAENLNAMETPNTNANPDACAGLAGPTGSPISEAVAGLMRDRASLLKTRHDLLGNTVWLRFDEHWKKLTEEVREIDARVDRLLMTATLSENVRMSEGADK